MALRPQPAARLSRSRRDRLRHLRGRRARREGRDIHSQRVRRGLQLPEPSLQRFRDPRDAPQARLRPRRRADAARARDQQRASFGRVKRGSQSRFVFQAPAATSLLALKWSGDWFRRDCRYALQVYALKPDGSPSAVFANRPANQKCPRPGHAQASQVKR